MVSLTLAWLPRKPTNADTTTAKLDHPEVCCAALDRSMGIRDRVGVHQVAAQYSCDTMHVMHVCMYVSWGDQACSLPTNRELCDGIVTDMTVDCCISLACASPRVALLSSVCVVGSAAHYMMNWVRTFVILFGRRCRLSACGGIQRSIRQTA